jgi:hypothetical protein
VVGGRREVVPCFKILFSICLEGLRKTTKYFRTAGLGAEIRAKDVPNTKQLGQPLSRYFQWDCGGI